MARNLPIQYSPPSASSSDEEEEEEESSESQDDDAIQTHHQKDAVQEKYGDDDGEKGRPILPGGMGTKPNSDSHLNKDSAVHTESTPPPSRDSAVKPLSPKTKPKAQKEKEEVAGGNGEKSPKRGASTGSAFTRLWGDDDEILILNAMIQYRTNKGKNPSAIADYNDMHESVEESLQFKASTEQLYNKIKKLKQKYYIDVEKSKNGKDKSFNKHHDLKCVKLAKEIWGADEIERAESKKGGKVGASGSGGGGGIRVIEAKHLNGEKKEPSVKKPKQVLFEGRDGEGKEAKKKKKKRLVNEEGHGGGKELKKQKLGSIEVVGGEQKEVIAKKQKHVVNEEVDGEGKEVNVKKQKDVVNEEGNREGKESIAKKYRCLFSSLEAGDFPKGATAIVMLGKVGEERFIELEKECRILMEAKWELAVKENDLAAKLLKLGQDALKSQN